MKCHIWSHVMWHCGIFSGAAGVVDQLPVLRQSNKLGVEKYDIWTRLEYKNKYPRTKKEDE